MITIDSSEKERCDELKNKILTVVAWDKTKEIIIKEPDKTISQTLLGYAKELGLLGSAFHIANIEEAVLFNKRTVGESIAAMCRQRSDLLNLAKLFTVLEQVLGNAILIEVEQYRHSQLKKASQIAGVYQYLSAFCDDEFLYPVKITVQRYKKAMHSKVYVTITVGKFDLEHLQIKDKKEALPNVGLHPSHADGESLAAGVASFTISIQQLVKIFNRDESVILKNFPDGMLSEKQLEIKRKVEIMDREREELKRNKFQRR